MELTYREGERGGGGGGGERCVGLASVRKVKQVEEEEYEGKGDRGEAFHLSVRVVIFFFVCVEVHAYTPGNEGQRARCHR